MGSDSRIPLAEAQALAASVVEFLAPWCERIEVAGSVRRCRAEVGDLEIVCVPRVAENGILDLFGVPDVRTPAVNLLDDRVRVLVEGDIFAHRLDKNGRKAFGTRYKRLSYQGIGVDLFSVLPPAQWGVLFTIRTGCAEFSHKLVTSRLLGGWLPAGCQVKDGAIWRDGAALPMPDEADVFGFLNAPFLPPERRTDTVTLWRAKGQPAQWIDRTKVAQHAD